MTRQQELEKRLEALKVLRDAEPEGTTYREDLELSIKTCENQLGYMKKNPHGFQYVNGR